MLATKQRDYYKILGVKKKSTLKDIKKSYRELARKFHPDTNQGSKKAEEKFKIISEAYETLRNKKSARNMTRDRVTPGVVPGPNGTIPAGITGTDMASNKEPGNNTRNLSLKLRKNKLPSNRICRGRGSIFSS